MRSRNSSKVNALWPDCDGWGRLTGALLRYRAQRALVRISCTRLRCSGLIGDHVLRVLAGRDGVQVVDIALASFALGDQRRSVEGLLDRGLQGREPAWRQVRGHQWLFAISRQIHPSNGRRRAHGAARHRKRSHVDTTAPSDKAGGQLPNCGGATQAPTTSNDSPGGSHEDRHQASSRTTGIILASNNGR